MLREISLRSAGTAKAEFLALDLGDLDSVRQCAQAFNARQLPLNLLINNAGLAGQKGFTNPASNWPSASAMSATSC